MKVFTKYWYPEGIKLLLSSFGAFLCCPGTNLSILTSSCGPGTVLLSKRQVSITVAEQTLAAAGAHQDTASPNLGGREDFSRLSLGGQRGETQATG